MQAFGIPFLLSVTIVLTTEVRAGCDYAGTFPGAETMELLL